MKRQPPSYDESRVTPARVAALEALFDVSYGNAADEALDDAFRRRRNMSAADKALAMELTYGVLRHRRRLDDAIAKHCKKGLPDLPLLDIMRLGAYSLAFLDLPPHATVSTAVEAARATKGEEAAAKFANAVLRAVSQDPAAIASRTPPAADASRKDLARYFSFPDWIADGFADIAGDALSALLAASNERPPLTLRAKPGTREALLAELPGARAGRFAKDAIVFDSPRGSGGPEAPRGEGAARPSGEQARKGRIDELPGFREGRFAIQDEGAQLVTELLGDIRGAEVLDACAAPGGKAIHAAQLGAKVVAVDASEKRLTRANEAAQRLGATLTTIAAEVTKDGIAPLVGRLFPFVLVDAPCSATGIIRRKPDVKWVREKHEIRKLAERQAAILEGAAKHLAPGGRLVYAVCSLLKEEGEGVVDPFLERHPELTLVAPPQGFAAGRYFRCRPDLHGTDGFFAAVVEQRG